MEPGLHFLLNPFCSYKKEISKQTQIQRLPSFPVKSLDNVDATAQVDITFKINDPLKLYKEVSDPENTFIEQVKAAFSSAMQTLNFSHVTSAEINCLAGEAGHTEHKKVVPPTSSSSSSSGPTSGKYSGEAKVVDSGKSREGDGIAETQLIQDGAAFFKNLLDSCKEWGISIINFRIISIEAKHKTVSEALELTAKAEVEAKAQLKAAKSQADTIRMLAEAEKDAQVTRAKAAVLAAKELEAAESKESSTAMKVYTQENSVRAAQALGGRSNVIVGMDNSSNGLRFAGRSFAAFSGGLPRSRSEGSLNQLEGGKRQLTVN